MSFLVRIFDILIWKKIGRGIFVIDKKAGVTSFDEVFFVRKFLSKTFKKKIKVGHSGTLDPKVVGILPIGCARATKTLEYILLSEKKYIAEFVFHKKIEKKDLEKAIKNFTGKILQTPPVKSAVKRQEREREVYEMKILNFSDDGRYARIFCAVEKGTYIRKLAHDMGEFLGVGASMENLERVAAGVFSKKNSRFLTSEKLSDILENFSKCKFCLIKKIIYFFILKRYIYKIEELFLRLEKKEKINIIFVKKKSVKYILSGNSARIKNIDFKKTKKNILKNKINIIFYKNPINFFSSGRALAEGEFLEDFENLEKKEKKKEKEILKIKKVF